MTQARDGWALGQVTITRHPEPPRTRGPLSTYNAPVAAPILAQQERKTLCDLFVELGSEAPTLCEGWFTADLAAHLVVRERRPDSGPGLVWPALADYTDKVRRAVRDRTPYLKLVETVRRGPPLLLRPFDGPMNTVEFFIHVEDVRRAQDWLGTPTRYPRNWLMPSGRASGLAGWPRKSLPRS